MALTTTLAKSVSHILTIGLFLLLTGCGTLTYSGLEYDPMPNIHEVNDPQQVETDVHMCTQYAAQASNRYSYFAGAASFSAGAASSASTLAVPGVGIWGIVWGGLGGFTANLSQWLGVNDMTRPRALQRCLWDKFAIDHAAILVEAPL